MQPLTLEVPVNMRVAKRGIGGRVNGAFEDSRVLYPLPLVVSPAQDLVVSIAPDSPQAQPIQVADQAIVATAIDLLLAVTKNGALLLDLRDDLNGKPASSSLLPKPVEFQIAGPIGGPPEGSDATKASWVSVQLPAPFQFQAGKRYWLLLQSIEGEASWSVEPVKPAEPAKPVEPTKPPDVGMQRTPDGGLSWRVSTASASREPVSALFRLRGKPDAFTMPVEIEIGSEDPARGLKPERVTLNRFAPLGRVDFTLDFDEVADGFNRFLDNAAPTLCPEGEHLVNGEFEKWLQIGDELMEPTTIALNQGRTPEALAVSPNGSNAYVVSDIDVEDDLLQVVDVVCGRVVESQDLPLSDIPTLIVVSPDGSRAYVVVQNTELQVIDLDAREVLGAPFSPAKNNGDIISMALSQDGGLLFCKTDKAIGAIDTAALERFVTGAGGKDPPTTTPLPPPNFRGYSTAKILALAGNGAATPDGKFVIVPNADTNNVTVTDIATEAVVATIAVGENPVAVAISPDGAHAYVANQDANTVSVIDLKRQVVVGQPINVGKAPIAIALTPNGDCILVANRDDSSLSSIQIGLRQPHEWNLVSGQVMPYCLPEPFHLIALLGEPDLLVPSLPRDSSKTKDNTMPSILSQMVPVTESCPYEIHFLGIASSEGAAAEVRWLDQNATLIGSDPERVPIDTIPVAFTFQQDASAELGAAAALILPLSLHHKWLPAPNGATQAEIRFVVSGGVAAAIDNVSFHASTEAVVNSDFSLREDDRLVGWSLSPGAARGISLLAIDSGIRLQNAGAETVELVQTIPANRSQFFELQVESQVLRSKTDGNPRVEVRWLKDGVPLTEEIVLDIPMESFSALRTNGTSPETATQAEIHLIVPPGATQELKRVSLTFTPTVTIPLAFVAQTSGELTVSALRVAFEKAKTPRPAIPETGLFMPAPAQANGETEPGEDGCFCACCKSTEPMTNATTMTTEAGRPVQVGGCTTCGDQLVRFGGPVIPNVPAFTLRNEPAAKPVVLTRSVARLAPHQEDAPAATPPPKLVDIVHIGEARERRLVAAGIASVAKLAATPAKRVVELLKPGVSEEMARKFIRDAARLAKGQ